MPLRQKLIALAWIGAVAAVSCGGSQTAQAKDPCRLLSVSEVGQTTGWQNVTLEKGDNVSPAGGESCKYVGITDTETHTMVMKVWIDGGTDVYAALRQDYSNQTTFGATAKATDTTVPGTGEAFYYGSASITRGVVFAKLRVVVDITNPQTNSRQKLSDLATKAASGIGN